MTDQNTGQDEKHMNSTFLVFLDLFGTRNIHEEGIWDKDNSRRMNLSKVEF